MKSLVEKGVVIALLLAAACHQLSAEEATPVAGWTEDFNTKSWVERWVPYGRLADGTWAQGIEGHWPKGEKSIFSRPEWWQLEEGMIRGTNFPEEAHAAGLSRRDKFARPFQQTGVRVRCRLRLGDAATARIRIGGTSPGIKPDEATDNHVAVVDVRPAGIRFWNGNRVLVAEEPQTDPAAGVDAKPKRQFKNDVLEQVSDRPITPLEWHDVLYEVKQRDIRVLVDGAEALTYQLPHEQPIQSFSLEVDGDKRSAGKAWFDEVAVEPLLRK
jgi:hypothetical protein